MINAKQIRSCSSEFLSFVQDCEANKGNTSWKETIYTRSIQVDGAEVSVYCYVMGRNASHQFALAVSKDGDSWFRIDDGEREIPVDKWSEEEHTLYTTLRDAASGKPNDTYSEELAIEELTNYLYRDGEVSSVIGWTTEVKKCATLEEAGAGYMGHW